MRIDVFTLFPHWFDWFRTQRHVANAAALGHTLETVDYRDTTPMKNGRVDDVPFGGGAGMVLRVDVVEAALRARYGIDPVELREQRRVIALTPGGRLLDDALADTLAGEEDITLLCGRYEGFDQRVIDHFCTEELSIGRYVLAGGRARGDGGGGHGAAQAAGLARATPTRPRRSPSAPRWKAARSTRTTRARPTGAAGRCPTCCSPGTTSRSANGAWSRAAAAAGREGPLP